MLSILYNVLVSSIFLFSVGQIVLFIVGPLFQLRPGFPPFYSVATVQLQKCISNCTDCLLSGEGCHVTCQVVRK